MTYTPKPLRFEDTELDESLNELQEAIAENVHDIWAEKRINEGWKFGPNRDDNKKETPDLVKYSALPESEKEYDRAMAMNTLKLIKSSGYDIVKREETEIYRLLMERIRQSEQKFHCSHCKKESGTMTPLLFGWEFCPKCGRKIDIDWNLYK
jgi:hypothetical protein